MLFVAVHEVACGHMAEYSAWDRSRRKPTLGGDGNHWPVNFGRHLLEWLVKDGGNLQPEEGDLGPTAIAKKHHVSRECIDDIAGRDC